MRRIFSIVLVTLGLLVIAQSGPPTTQSFSIIQYLYPRCSYDMSSDLNKNVREALFKLKIEKDSDPEKVLEQVRTLADSDDDDNAKQVYKTMLMAVDRDSIDGLEPLIELMKSILLNGIWFSRMKDSLPTLKKLLKFDRFASLVEADFAEDKQIGVLNSLDSVFEKALDADKKITSTNPDERSIQLLDKLAKFDMAKHYINVPSALKAIAGSESVLAESKDDRLKLFTTFMTSQCAVLQRYKPKIEIVLLARRFYGRDIENLDLRRMSEYHRICLGWLDNWPVVGSGVLSNVKDQLSLSGRLARKMLPEGGEVVGNPASHYEGPSSSLVERMFLRYPYQ